MVIFYILDIYGHILYTRYLWSRDPRQLIQRLRLLPGDPCLITWIGTVTFFLRNNINNHLFANGEVLLCVVANVQDDHIVVSEFEL